MSYDENQHSPRPRRARGTLTIVIAALVPSALAGWLVWLAMSGPDDSEPPKVLPLPSGQTTVGKPGPDASDTPSPTPPATSTPAPTPSAPPKGGAAGPLAGKVVVVDPGHNPGNFKHTSEINKLVDIGTNRKECDTTGTSTNDGYTEAAFTRDVSQRLRTLLEKQGATVEFTHDNDRAFGPCVDERARIGNKAKADAVVSVHADGSAAGNRGFHVILPALVSAGGADTTAIVGPVPRPRRAHRREVRPGDRKRTLQLCR